MIAERQDIELDSGPRARAAERLCVATRTVRPVSDLIRFVVGPEGDAVPDVKRRLPGRGIWVTATQEALDEAIRRKAFARGFKREVRLPSDLVARTERQLERAALDALAVAGKAGLVATGFAKAEAVLERGDAIALLHAAEASPEGIRKLDSAVRRGRGGPLPVIGFLTSTQLDLALNRPNVVHAALLAGPVSETFLARCRRLERFRAGDQHNRAGMAGPE
ncbi:MAG: RNA-binding protein [Xanthobacteraceae bacterium]